MSQDARSGDQQRNGHAKADPHAIFTTPGLIDAAMQEAARRAIRRHKLLGESIAVWKDGKVVVVPPDEIEVPGAPESASGDR